MKGSIQRRGDAWRIMVDGGVHPVTGKRTYITKTVHGTKAEAQDALNRLLADVSRGDATRHGHDSSVAQLLEAWLAVATLSVSTRLDYRRAIASHITGRPLASMPVWKVRAHHLDALYAALDAGGLGPARIRRVHNILRRALAQAVRWQWISRNPAADASPPAVPHAKVEPPTPDEVRAILAACDGQLRVFVFLSAHLGGRRGEVCALQWSDADLEAGSVKIRRNLVEGGPGIGVVAKTTKTDDDRTIALDPFTVAALRAWRSERSQQALAAGLTLGPWVFASDPAGITPPRPDSMGRRFAKLRDELGLGHVHPHSLRHFVATQLLAAGVDVRTVSGRLGHKRTSTTLDLYAAFVPARDRDAADLLGRIIAG